MNQKPILESFSVYSGNGLPNAEQTQLLQACLCSGSLAQEAWKNWIHRVHFQKLDLASHKLLPLVARNPALGSIKDPIFEQCKGVYRQTWVANQLHWKKMLPLLSQLQQAGVEKIVILKGMAMILHYYKDFGMRVIGDIDILIEKTKLQAANLFFRSSGWKQSVWARLDVTNEEHLNRWHALNFAHDAGMNLDLHWSLIEENSQAVDAAVLKEAKKLSIGDVCLHIPNPTDLLFQTCVHGLKYSPIPLIRWVADAMTILKHSEKEINWDRLVELSSKARVCKSLSFALQYLAEKFDAPISSYALQQLKVAPSHRLEYLEYRSHVYGSSDFARWHRYCLNRGYLTTKSQLSHILEYLQLTARLKSPWQIPFYAIYWMLKRLYRSIRSFC